MALTFPRAMPSAGPAQQVFEPQRPNFETAEAGGALFGIAAGVKRWRGEWTLGRALSGTLSDEWRAFIGSLDGAARAFLGREFGRTFPRLYPNGFTGLTRAGGGAFDGSLTSWSQTITADSQALMTLNGLPAGFQVSIGDLIDFRWTTLSTARRHLVRAQEAATANGSGVIANLTVDPPIHVLVVPVDAVAHLDDPACVMRLTSETEITAMDRRKVAGARIVAMQDLRP